MSAGEIFDTVGNFIDGISGEDGGSEEENLYDLHMTLHHRMDIVVKVLIREGRKEEAMKFVVAFFTNTGDLSKLDKIVKAGEEASTTPSIVRPVQEVSLEPTLGS